MSARESIKIKKAPLFLLGYLDLILVLIHRSSNKNIINYNKNQEKLLHIILTKMYGSA